MSKIEKEIGAIVLALEEMGYTVTVRGKDARIRQILPGEPPDSPEQCFGKKYMTLSECHGCFWGSGCRVTTDRPR